MTSDEELLEAALRGDEAAFTALYRRRQGAIYRFALHMSGEAMVHLRAPGIGPDEEMAAYLWDLHIAAVAGDNPSLEAWPPGPESGGFLHFRLIPLLGMNIGELWYLEDLAADCAQDGVYEFMLTSAPLNVPGGVGSPPNALAIK